MSAHVQVIQFKVAPQSVNHADMSTMTSSLYEVTERVDNLKKDIAQTVENLEEAATSGSQRPMCAMGENHCMVRGQAHKSEVLWM